MKEKIRAAVIGAGMIARAAHIPALLSAGESVELVAVCDRDAETAAACAKDFSVPRWYADEEALLREERPDLVCVCTPNGTHVRITRLALENGANVICEKPLALSYREGLGLYRLAEEKGLCLAACQTQRFQRGILAAQEYVSEGLLGTPYYGDIERIRRRGIPTWGNFLKRSANGGGALADIGVHAIDAILWIMGNPRVLGVTGVSSRAIIAGENQVRSSSRECGMLSGPEISVLAQTADSDVEDFATGMIRTEKAPITFRIGWAAHLPDANRLTVLGDRMGLTAPDMRVYGALGQDQCDFTPRLFPLGPWDDQPFSGHYYLIHNVADALLGRARLVIRPEETLNTLAAIDLFYMSAEAGREAKREEIEIRPGAGEHRRRGTASAGI